MKKIVNIYAYIFACCWVLLDRFGAWMEYQVDHNDYLAGFLLALVFFAIPYILGIISIVFVEG